MNRLVIIATYWFASSSSNRTYETLVYADGASSCNCKGWTFKRVTPSGQVGPRSCSHTRMVEAGLGENHSVKYLTANNTAPAPAVKAHKPVPPPAPGKRKFLIT